MPLMPSCLVSNAVGVARKPNSVPDASHLPSGNDHSSKDAGCPAPLATYPGARTGSPQTLLYLVLHRVGFAELLRSPGELVRSYRTVSPLPQVVSVFRKPLEAVYFLLHFPSRHRDSTLWSTLPCGVRTFLRIMQDDPAIVWTAPAALFGTCESFHGIFPIDNPLAMGTKG